MTVSMLLKLETEENLSFLPEPEWRRTKKSKPKWTCLWYDKKVNKKAFAPTPIFAKTFLTSSFVIKHCNLFFEQLQFEKFKKSFLLVA